MFSAKTYKTLFFFFLGLTIYVAVVMGVLPFIEHPRLVRFENYQALENWDLSMHGRGDFDGDGQRDMITFNGCAFLSAVDSNSIPEDQRCIAPGMVEMEFPNQSDRIGQKYADAVEYNLALNSNQPMAFTHSYLGKYKNEPWRVYVDGKNGLEIKEITSDGKIVDGPQPTILDHLNETLYFFSSWFFILALPLIPLFIISGIAFGSVRNVNDSTPTYEVISLAITTLAFFYLWNRSTSKKPSKNK